MRGSYAYLAERHRQEEQNLEGVELPECCIQTRRLDHPDQDFRKKLDPDDQESPEDDFLDQLFWKKLDPTGQFEVPARNHIWKKSAANDPGKV
ncbi:MAG: hypothetical protein AB7W16_01330 [Candidatus Obscuribacterales bacterium]